MPEEQIPVGDGLDDYVWPNEEVRRRAMDQVVALAKQIAAEEISRVTQGFMADLSAKLSQIAETTVKQLDDLQSAQKTTNFDARLTRIEGLLALVERWMQDANNASCSTLFEYRGVVFSAALAKTIAVESWDLQNRLQAIRAPTS